MAEAPVCHEEKKEKEEDTVSENQTEELIAVLDALIDEEEKEEPVSASEPIAPERAVQEPAVQEADPEPVLAEPIPAPVAVKLPKEVHEFFSNLTIATN